MAAVGDFNGRWNLRPGVEARGRAWWLEVTGAGTPAMKGRFVGAPGGQMDEIPAMRIEGNELIWEFQRNYSRAKQGDPPAKGVYRARVENGGLLGSFEVPGRPGTKVEFTGKRAPLIKDKDDGSWQAGKPVELVNGKDLNGWISRVTGRPIEWDVKDGILVNRERASDIMSQAKFWNFRLRAEFRVGKGSNSGIGLRARYEVQILEDYGKPLDGHSNGGIYSRIIPAVNASKPAGEWQSFDVTLIGRDVTVIVNGQKVIDRKEIEGLTAMATDPDEDRPGPISLQGDHGIVEFRKITVTPMIRK
jgi:hypothetical protein